MILHITSRAEWDAALRDGAYRAPSLEAEGFIHCSTEAQALAVANAFYRGRRDLVLLVIDPARLSSELKWEPPAGPPAPGVPQADAFPHVYGPLNLEAVARVRDFPPDADGTWSALPR